MKTKMTTALVIAMGALALAVNAQDNNQSTGGSPPDGAGGGQRKQGHPPGPGVFRGLGAKHDRVIDGGEKPKASRSLEELGKKWGGKTKPEEINGPPSA